MINFYDRFIYTGEVFVPQHELKDFLRTAELLEIKGLLKVTNIISSGVYFGRKWTFRIIVYFHRQ